MTFIASIIARDGIAIVADSFTTSMDRFLDEDTFLDYLRNRANPKKDIPVSELIPKFVRKPSYTRNYTDKLVQFDDNSAVTTTGMAYLNEKLMADQVLDISKAMRADPILYGGKSKDEIVNDFTARIRAEVLEHLKKLSTGGTDFIFSTFDASKNAPRVFVITINPIDKDKFDPADPSLVTIVERSYLKVISDGQDMFVDRLIFGTLYRNTAKINDIFLKYFFKKVKLSKAKKDEITKDVTNFDFLKDLIYSDFSHAGFRELSLQEAVDLAALLIKIVMDLQVYTEKIPTVGGVIRLAVIRKQGGFSFVSGDEILKPKII
jgi:hypothetical protein